MQRLIFLSIISILLINSPAWADPSDGLDYQSESVATADQITAGIFNPAGLAAKGAMGVRYAHSFTDSTYKGDDALLISSRRGFFALEWLNHTSNIFRRKYTLGIGDRLAPNFYGGLAYSWFGGASPIYKNKKVWKLGLLYRPRAMLSLGLAIDRLNQPVFENQKQKRIYRWGVGTRPFGKKFTFSSDARWLEGDGIEKLQGNFRIAAGPYRGVFLAADYATEGLWRIGLTFSFDQMRMGTQGRLAESKDFGGGSYFFELGAIRYGSVLERSDRTGILKLTNDIVEEPAKSLPFRPGPRTTYSVINALRRGAADPRIRSLFVKIDGMPMTFAVASEIRDAILDYRRAKKEVIAYIETGGDLSYYVASAADKIYMSPSGYLELNGLSATATFYKRGMEKLGIEAQVVRTGPHKTYGDAFTKTGLTPEAREQIEWLLDDLYEQLVDGIAAGRGIPTNKARRLIDEGPFTAKQALKAGLIDGLKYYDEFVGPEEGSLVHPVDLGEFYNTEDYDARWSEPKRIAVVYANGDIVEGKSGRGIWYGKRIGAETLAGALRRVRSDDNIRAVVLRVNSPGGELSASDKIYRELESLKGKKPLVVSMAGVAASGGYYISTPGDEILASPGTITGSIGVVVGKADLSGFYEKIGVNKETIRRGKRADIRSLSRPATEDEIELVEKQVWQYYDDFVSKVSTWRKLDYDSVDAVGRGRVWTGRQALDRGLVDSYGGIWEAIELARLRAGISPEDRVVIEAYPHYGFSLFRWTVWPTLDSGIADIFEKVAGDGWFLKMPFDLSIE
jgi:protease-4